MASQRIAKLLQAQAGNADLNKPAMAQVMRGQGDLAADGLIRPLDERIIAATAEALESGQTHYVDVPGIAPLRAAVAEFLAGFCGASYEQGNVVVTAGMQEARFLTIQMIGAQFDGIAIPAVAHPGVGKALGTRQRTVISLAATADSGYLPTVESIAETVAGGCRLLYLESPSRLSGAVYSADEAAAISDIAQQHDAGIIWDQGLAVWVDGACASPAAHDPEAARVACIGEAFPGMGLASWFIGYIAAPEAWVAPMQSQKQIMSICTSTASQYGALEASQHFADARASQLTSLASFRAEAMAIAGSAGLSVVPGAASSIMALRSDDGAAAMLAKLNTAGYDAASGVDFGAPDAIRVNITHQTADALRALA